MSLETLGPYELGTPLGKGGMGTVYRGVDRESGEAVAVKVLNPRLAAAEGFRERFDAEIESLKSLRHASIVRLYGYGEEAGVLFYAMELVDGQSLEDELRQGRRFDWREVTAIGIQVARALKHAHDHGVIHRDLKPANILLDRDGRPKLADFGIARVFGSTGVTIAGGVLGTADYMSPEQAAGRPVNARCDQYCLGGVLYALLAGRPPFRATDLAAMLQLQRFAVPEPVRRFAPNTPVELERIIEKLLEKDPVDRFPNTQVVARRLEAMGQALSRVGSDDFEVYQTGQTPAAVPDTGDPAVSLAATREATSDNGDPLRERRAVAPAFGTTGTVYTRVDPDADRGPVAGSWRELAGQAGLLLAALAALAGLAWWLGRPLTADELFERVAQSADELDASAAAVDAVREFGRRFSDDPRCEQVAEWGESLRLEQLRRKLQLARLGGLRLERTSPEETLLRRAAKLAADDPDAGAAAFDRLAELIRAGGDASSRDATLADVATREAQRLRDAAHAERSSLAEFGAARLDTARRVAREDPESARKIARGLLELLPESPETRAVHESAAELAKQTPVKQAPPEQAPQPPVAPESAVR